MSERTLVGQMVRRRAMGVARLALKEGRVPEDRVGEVRAALLGVRKIGVLMGKARYRLAKLLVATGVVVLPPRAARARLDPAEKEARYDAKLERAIPIVKALFELAPRAMSKNATLRLLVRDQYREEFGAGISDRVIDQAARAVRYTLTHEVVTADTETGGLGA